MAAIVIYRKLKIMSNLIINVIRGSIEREIAKPIHINCGYRTPEHNSKVGGVSSSCHLTAKAADISVKGMTPKEVHKAILDLISEGKIREGGLGLYNTFVHYDIRGTAARWGNK